ncbi:hypothetical protein TeGR_g6987 [Tetraparma gracilis]|uniref:Uncharacterized protein n=1 Tax=Tetraparma gracilis TaxID=2962635 RepID=A0ABQ6N448_9STRA|nr:hypothetical protein TeGR_g6987 [Tetraparma gracilis]
MPSPPPYAAPAVGGWRQRPPRPSRKPEKLTFIPGGGAGHGRGKGAAWDDAGTFQGSAWRTAVPGVIMPRVAPSPGTGKVPPGISGDVEVYWPADDRFYSGVASCIGNVGLSLVEYDDGAREVLDMGKERWRRFVPAAKILKKRRQPKVAHKDKKGGGSRPPLAPYTGGNNNNNNNNNNVTTVQSVTKLHTTFTETTTTTSTVETKKQQKSHKVLNFGHKRKRNTDDEMARPWSCRPGRHGVAAQTLAEFARTMEYRWIAGGTN